MSEVIDKTREPLLPLSKGDEAHALEDDGVAENGSLVPQLTPSPPPHGDTHWLLTTCILLGDMFGLGTLSLPGDFARLGWVPAGVMVAFCILGDLYSGSLYTRLAEKVAHATVFDEIGSAALGGLGQALVFGSCYLAIFCEPIMFHLTTTEALMQILFSYNISRKAASLAVVAMILPLAQVQQMHEVGWIAITGTLGMLLSVVVILVKLLVGYASGPSVRTTEVVASAGLRSTMVGLMDIAFTYGGQVNWMRYITTMKKKSQFVHAVVVTTGAMSVVYIIVGSVGYFMYGTSIDVTQPITSILAKDSWSVVMNFGLFLHCVIAYQININVWTSSLLDILSRSQPQPRTTSPKWTTWLLVSTACVMMSAGLSYVFPFFSVVMAIIASLGDISSMFGLPCLFGIKLLRMRRLEVVLCWGLVAVSLALSALGVFSSVGELIAAYYHAK